MAEDPQTHSATGRLPDFLIIGGMKCGTTTLYDYLVRHPRIHMSPNKEPSYFSDHRALANGEAWYQRLFAGAAPDQLCGEASTSYSRLEEFRIGVHPEEWISYQDTPQRIAATLPDVKLIFIMRHPVERAYSHYSFLMQYETPISFEQALEHHKTILETSRYIDHINRYLEYFPRAQLLCLLFDDLQQDPESLLRSVQQFLGIEPMALADQPIVSNPSGSGFATLKVKRHLEAWRSKPLVRQIGRVIPRQARRQAFQLATQALAAGLPGQRLAAQHHARISEMTPDLRAQLLEELREPTQALEAFLGRRLPTWFV